MIKCNKCGGRVFYDYTYGDAEAFCFHCGKRWFTWKTVTAQETSAEVSNGSEKD